MGKYEYFVPNPFLVWGASSHSPSPNEVEVLNKHIKPHPLAHSSPKKKELMWLIRVGHRQAIFYWKSGLLRLESKEPSWTLPLSLPASRLGRHSDLTSFVLLRSLSPTMTRPLCPLGKALHSSLGGWVNVLEPCIKGYWALPRIKWIFPSLCGYQFFVYVLCLSEGWRTGRVGLTTQTANAVQWT